MTPLPRRMIDDMQIRNLAPPTQTSYVQQVSLFARHFGQPPERLGREEIRACQIYLAQDKHLAASSISVAETLQSLGVLTPRAGMDGGPTVPRQRDRGQTSRLRSRSGPSTTNGRPGETSACVAVRSFAGATATVRHFP
jgi:hypothetical protein